MLDVRCSYEFDVVEIRYLPVPPRIGAFLRAGASKECLHDAVLGALVPTAQDLQVVHGCHEIHDLLMDDVADLAVLASPTVDLLLFLNLASRLEFAASLQETLRHPQVGPIGINVILAVLGLVAAGPVRLVGGQEILQKGLIEVCIIINLWVLATTGELLRDQATELFQAPVGLAGV